MQASQPVEGIRLTACKQQPPCITKSCFWSCLRRLVKILKIEMLPELLVPMISCTVMDSETSGKFVRGRSYLMMYRFVRSSLAQWLPHKICSSLFLLFFSSLQVNKRSNNRATCLLRGGKYIFQFQPDLPIQFRTLDDSSPWLSD